MQPAGRGVVFMYERLVWLILVLGLMPSSLCLAGEYKQIVVATGSPFELGLPNLKYDFEYAEKLYDFWLSDRGQKNIAEFGKDQCGESIYFPWPKKYAPIQFPQSPEVSVSFLQFRI